MGVHGLRSLLEGKGKRVSLTATARDCKAATGKPLYLAVDGYALLFWLLKCVPIALPVPDSRFGGQHHVLAQEAAMFVERLRGHGIEMVVAFDGPMHPDKLEETIRRTRWGITTAARTWRNLWHSGDCDPVDAVARLPLLSRQALADVLAKLNVRIVECIAEADPVCAALCKESCFAAVSNDSDFFCFGVRYIPLNSVTFTVNPKNDIEADLFRPEDVATALGIEVPVGSPPTFLHIPSLLADPGESSQLLPLLACLAGNDYTTGLTATPANTLEGALDYIKRSAQDLSPLASDPAKLAAAVTKDPMASGLLVRGLVKYRLPVEAACKFVDIPNLPPELLPSIGQLGSLAGAISNKLLILPIQTEDLGQWHPDFRPFAPISVATRTLRTALYSLILGPNAKVTEYWNSWGRLMQDSIAGTWPFSIPQAPFAEIFSKPAEVRANMLFELFHVLPHQLDVAKAHFPDSQFATIVACILGFLVHSNSESQLPLDAPIIGAMFTYFSDRKAGSPFALRLGGTNSRDAPLVARGVHLFCLMVTVWKSLIDANEVLGKPIAQFPPPQDIFDGATWQVLFRGSTKLKLTTPAAAFIEEFCPTLLAPKPKAKKSKKAKSNPNPKCKDKKPADRSEEAAASKNPFEALGDD